MSARLLEERRGTDMRKISVIIPCYNVAHYIDRCITSVIAQTIGMEQFEIICIDDASTDDTWSHLQRWETLFPNHVLLYRQEVNRRQGAARNIGLQCASGEYIAFVDADDWLEPDYLEQLYAPTAQYACDVVCCGRIADTSEVLTYADEDNRIGGKNSYFVVDTEIERRLWIRNKILGNEVWGKLIHKKLIMDFQLFFPEKLVYEDMYWLPLLHVYAKSTYYVGKKLYHYFLGNDSTIRSMNQDYHMDFLTIQMRKWADWGQRGLLAKYRSELELDALRDAACFVQQLVLRYDQPSFSFFQLESELIRQYVPEYMNNPYLKKDADGMEMFFFIWEALFHPMNSMEFQGFVMKVRAYLIK